jgi:phosphoenolpyruvate carboxykinase (ATP)
VYARQLGDRIAKHQSQVWLVNTGWTGGPHGIGSRMKIAYTRAMISAALSGALGHVSYQKHAIFNIEVPASVPGVPAEVLDPRGTWSDKAGYDAQATKLARMFVENFRTNFADADPSVAAAGPQISQI